MLDIDAQLAFGQVTDMTHRSGDIEPFAKILLYRFRFCRRFNDHEIGQ